MQCATHSVCGLIKLTIFVPHLLLWISVLIKLLIHEVVFFLGYYGKGCSHLPLLPLTGLCQLEICFLKEDAVTSATMLPKLNAIELLIKNLYNLKKAT